MTEQPAKRSVSSRDDGVGLLIVGAGSVGATIAYAVMHQGLARRIYLADRDEAKAEAQAADLNHGRMFVSTTEVFAAEIEACGRVDIVVITAGAKQKKGQSRLDLTKTNVAMMRSIMPRISAAHPDAIVLMVSNPVDVLTYAALRFSGGRAEQILGSGTVLDTARFRFLLARRLRVSVSNVHGYIIGEHGDSEVPLWSRAHVGMIPLMGFAPDLSVADRERIFSETRGAAGSIIAAKGATNWAIGLSVARILESIVRNERAVLTVSRLLDGFLGESDVCLSVPAVVSASGVGASLPVEPDAEERAAFKRSAEVVREVIRSVGL